VEGAQRAGAGACRALLHHLLGLPLGTAYFCWLVTGLSLGLGLAITLAGIPLLTAVLASVRPLMAGERALANELLDARLPALPLAPSGKGLLGRLAAYWTDGPTWRGLAYLLARFPVGTFTFCVAVTAYATALYGIAAPLIAPLSAIDLGFWRVNTVLEGLTLVPLGLLALVAAAWLSEGMAAMSRGLARWATPEPSPGLLDAAL
jgi:Putative sensor